MSVILNTCSSFPGKIQQVEGTAKVTWCQCLGCWQVSWLCGHHPASPCCQVCSGWWEMLPWHRCCCGAPSRWNGWAGSQLWPGVEQPCPGLWQEPELPLYCVCLSRWPGAGSTDPGCPSAQGCEIWILGTGGAGIKLGLCRRSMGGEGCVLQGVGRAGGALGSTEGFAFLRSAARGSAGPCTVGAAGLRSFPSL